jgi:hypothetical protein
MIVGIWHRLNLGAALVVINTLCRGGGDSVVGARRIGQGMGSGAGSEGLSKRLVHLI